MVSYRVNALVPYWRYFKLPKDYQLDRSLKAVRAFAEEMIGHARERRRRSPGESPKNLLEAMLALRDEPDSGFSDDDVYANIITLLLAGEDTTAYSVAWAMHMLAGDPSFNCSCIALRWMRSATPAPHDVRRHGQARSCSKALRSKRCE